MGYLFRDHMNFDHQEIYLRLKMFKVYKHGLSERYWYRYTLNVPHSRVGKRKYYNLFLMKRTAGKERVFAEKLGCRFCETRKPAPGEA